MTDTRAKPAAVAEQQPGDAFVPPPRSVRVRRALSFRNISAIYIFIAMFIVFSIWVPDTFLTMPTWRSLLSSNAITCIVAIGLCVPLSAGVFDLAVGTEVGLGAV